jgi:hypothetical protein
VKWAEGAATEKAHTQTFASSLRVKVVSVDDVVEAELDDEVEEEVEVEVVPVVEEDVAVQPFIVVVVVVVELKEKEEKGKKE